MGNDKIELHVIKGIHGILSDHFIKGIGRIVYLRAVGPAGVKRQGCHRKENKDRQTLSSGFPGAERWYKPLFCSQLQIGNAYDRQHQQSTEEKSVRKARKREFQEWEQPDKGDEHKDTVTPAQAKETESFSPWQKKQGDHGQHSRSNNLNNPFSVQPVNTEYLYESSRYEYRNRRKITGYPFHVTERRSQRNGV